MSDVLPRPFDNVVVRDCWAWRYINIAISLLPDDDQERLLDMPSAETLEPFGQEWAAYAKKIALSLEQKRKWLEAQAYWLASAQLLAQAGEQSSEALIESFAGMDWASVIDTHLTAASVILLLISPSFLASDYSYSVEMKRALELHAKGHTRVIPLILRPVDWQATPIGKLQCLPRNAKPVTTWSNRDQAFAEIVRDIRNLVENINRSSSPTPQPASALFPATLDSTLLALYPEDDIETIQSKRYTLHRTREKIKKMKEEMAREKDVAPDFKKSIAQEERYASRLHQEIQTELHTVFSPLPRQPYVRFIGRKEKLTEIRQVLEKPEAFPIVAIDGIGGAGKTALARELSQQALEANTFYAVVWESDKSAEFTGANVQHQSTEDFSFENLLDRISRKLGYFDVANLRTTKEKKNLVHRILNAERYLIVIDNLETIKEYRYLINSLDGMFGYSKAILTTRKRIAEFRDVYSLSLGGMSYAESIEFLRSEAAEKGEAGRVILSASEPLLEKIFIATGGLPLAMRLVLGQTMRSSLTTVLQRLETVNYQKIQNPDSDENAYNQFFKFIYLDSLNQLSGRGRQLLIELGAFDTTEGAMREFLSEMSELSSQDLEEAVDELVEFSLVRRSWEGNQEILFLHPLTHRFVQENV
ncbi:MAG TPA: NB-ARC domain-containing protein [Ktedonobacteraceae bacterium]|nr:NB-ARC domain-containing protein [Ktedonobacteraceae bacterium]